MSDEKKMNTRKLEDMKTFEQARWYALIEAINIIGDECDERGKKFEDIKISPLDIEKYIEGTCDIFARKIEEEKAREQKKSIYFNLQKLALQLQGATA